MFKIKVYKYDSSEEANGYRGEDLSIHLLQPPEVSEDITQVLDTAEITLVGLESSAEFTPESKLIIDLVEMDDATRIETILDTLHFCVSRDMVEKPILSDDNYYNHHISLIEPSVIAQKRLVDNIATTYKLKDVSLEQQVAYPDTLATMTLKSAQETPSENFGEVLIHQQSGFGYSQTIKQYSSGKYFVLENNFYFIDKDGNFVDTIYNNISNFEVAPGVYEVGLRLPKVAIMFGEAGTKTFSKIGYASIDCIVEEYTLTGTDPLSTTTYPIISTSDFGEGQWSSVNGWQDRVAGGWIIEKTEGIQQPGTTVQALHCYYKKYSTGTGGAEPSYVVTIPVNVDHRYKITICLHQFEDNLVVQNRPNWHKYLGEQPSFYVATQNNIMIVGAEARISETGTFKEMIYANNTSTTMLATYDTNSATIVFASGTPYSALTLLQKAIVNSALYEKKDGVYIGDINSSDTPFVIDNAFANKLAGTKIIENFYNQKNLWEIMVEVGHYIHAIPELKFGADDKFLITFNELGRTDQQDKPSTKLSIFNSRSVEDYISATSSYVSNMVQLGGVIQEWVSPKTTNEQMLVYNDTAQIITSKPIIELLELKVKNNTTGTVADMTQYIFEENVYKTLGLEYDIVPNRGLAMFYQLGTNVITGGDFQLPQANYNIYEDYAIKKIIYSAFNGYYIPPSGQSLPITGYWTNLEVNDYSFFVKYRTKDSVRQNHARPDLRKYLLNSKHDRIPEHNQFNNQTDIVVDSLKFGNNVYGNLIKTGNSNIIETEWNTNYDNVKHKGELYVINGGRYYVAKATHRYYSSYIQSSIEYSQDYNELSQIIGIPSEPRFYEISEQSLIRREFAINDMMILTDNSSALQIDGYSRTNYVFDYTHLMNLMFSSGVDFAKYALSVYKGDKDTPTTDQAVGEADLYKEVLNPVNAYASENTLTYEWDMIDNYSAGDKVLASDKSHYNSLRAVGYTDKFGKAALLDFFLLGDVDNLTVAQIKALPESPITTINHDATNYVGNHDILATNVKNPTMDLNGRGIGLLKDCREAISVNYNLQLITSSDTFVVSPFIFLPNKTNVYCVLLAEEVNKLSDGYIDNSTIIKPLDVNGNPMSEFFPVSIEPLTVYNSNWQKNVTSAFSVTPSGFGTINNGHWTDTEGYQRVKGIAIICNVPLNPSGNGTNSEIPYRTQFILARNIPSNWTKEQALQPLYFGAPIKNTTFTNKQ